MGINSSPIQVHGQCMINTKLEGNDKVIVVSPLTMEAILGLDFLVKMKAEIDIKEKQIRFRNGDWRCGINASSARSSSRSVVQAAKTVKIPTFSEVDIVAHIDKPTEGGTWLLEGRSVNLVEPSVARALVSPQSNTVVVQFLNHMSEEATMYKNSKITSMELLEEADLPATAVGCIEKRQPSSEQEAVLWDVVKG